MAGPTGQSYDQLVDAFAPLQSRQFDFADLFIQNRVVESWSLEDGHVREAGYGQDQGAGIRVNSGEQIGFAYTDDLGSSSLRAATSAAASMMAAGRGRVANLNTQSCAIRYTSEVPRDMQSADRVALLRALDSYTRALDPRVAEVSLSLVVQDEKMCVIDTDGQLAFDVRPLVRFGVSVIMLANGRRERGNAGGGGRITLSQLTQLERCQAWCDEAVRVASVNLEAVAAPAGNLPVVLGAGWQVYCCTRPSGMVWKATLTAKAPANSRA